MASALPATAFNVPPFTQLTLIHMQVFRWSALGVGVVYGVVHRNTLSKHAEHKRLQAEQAHKEELIKEARAEYQRQKSSNAGPSLS
jgi:F-type H+-transporting ATP synthase subunit e